MNHFKFFSSFFCVISLQAVASQEKWDKLQESVPSQYKNSYIYTGKVNETVLTLAGLVNRNSPKLYLLNGDDTWHGFSSHKAWKTKYEDYLGLQFHEITNIKSLLSRFSNYYRGAIIYDKTATLSYYPDRGEGDRFNWQAVTAGVMGGLTQTIPLTKDEAITYNIKTKRTWSVTNAPFSRLTGDLTISSHSWNDANLEAEDRYQVLMKWGLIKLIPHCNYKKMSLRKFSDYTVSEKMCHVGVDGKAGLDFKGIPEQRVKILESYVTALREISPKSYLDIYGWINPEPITQWISTFGATLHEHLYDNFSWHAAWKGILPGTHCENCDPKIEKPTKKYYISFLNSEPDAGNWNFGFFGGAYESKYRGDIPMSWGVNLHLLDIAPFLSHYYFWEATPNDGFFSGISPIGYGYIDEFNSLQHQSQFGAVKQGKRLVKQFKVYDNHGYKHYAPKLEGVPFFGKTIHAIYNLDKLSKFHSSVGTRTLFLYDPQLKDQRAHQVGSQVIFGHNSGKIGTFYSRIDDVDAYANKIKKFLLDCESPCFLMAGYNRPRAEVEDFNREPDYSKHDFTVSHLKKLMEKVKSDPDVGSDVEFVNVNRFSKLINRYSERTTAKELLKK